MSRPTLLPLLCVATLFCASVSRAVVTEFTWAGASGNSDASNSNNWVGSNAPSFSGGLEALIFPENGSDNVNFPTMPFSSNGDIASLNITGHYHFSGPQDSAPVYLRLFGGLTFSSSYQTHLVFERNLAVDIQNDQTWNIGTNGRVEFYDDAFITGEGTLTKAGAGLLDPGSDNSGWIGGLLFNEGTIVIRPRDGTSYSLGSGPVTIGPDTTHRPVFQVYDWSYSGGGGNEVHLANNFVLNGVFSSQNHAELKLGGNITLNANTTFRTSGEVTFIQGDITDGDLHSKFSVDSTSGIILKGHSNWSGGTEVTKGILIFGGIDGEVTVDNTPGQPGGILVGTDGYVGTGVASGVGAFIGQFNTASTGTIGFDSDRNSLTPTHFNTATTINLSAFNATVRLGSATSAILGSNITINPYGTDYRFGGGGGHLSVASQLTGARNLVLDSPAELPLTVRLINPSNNFTGSVSVTNSGLIFGDNSTAETYYLPSGTITMNSRSYIGTEDPDAATPLSLGTYLAKFSPTTQGIIGFDIAPGESTPREISGLGLAGFTGGVYVGTSSAVYDGESGEIEGPGLRLTGEIGPNSDSVHRFAAYKGGALEVAGTLNGSAMIIGSPDSLGAFGDRNRGEYSTVLISGNNAGKLTGGVTLYGGRLMVGQTEGDGVVGTDHTHALGEGTLTIAPVNFSLEEEDGPETPSPMIAVSDPNPEDENHIIISNPVVLNAPELNVGGDNNFTLSGVISGSGELYVGEETDGEFTLTLAGHNTFSGGVYVSDGANVIVAHDQGLGTGSLNFGSSDESSVTFTTAAPMIGGFESNGSRGDLNFDHASSIATINQSSEGVYRGQIRAKWYEGLGDALRVVKSGAGTLRLEEGGLYYHHGVRDSEGAPEIGLQVNQGTLVIGRDFFIEGSAPTIQVEGGTLALDRNPSAEYTNNQQWVKNPVIVGNGGRLAGRGAFSYYNVELGTGINIGGGAIVSPGLSGMGNIGTLAFDHLELDSGGIYEWHIGNADEAAHFGRDVINVGLQDAPMEEQSLTLVINATADNPSTRFTLKVISTDLAGTAGLAANFDPSEAYAWTIFTYDVLEGFDPTKFTIDASAFANSLSYGAGNGWFHLSDDGEGSLLLNFTPVPEPSTYALIGLGLGWFGLMAWRRRQA